MAMKCPSAGHVNITNLTFKQPLGITVVVFHSPEVSLFEEGGAASAALALLAEENDASGILELAADPAVAPFICGAGASANVTAPGGHFDAHIDLAYNASCSCDSMVVSVIGKLLATNDAFIGVQSVPVYPFGHHEHAGAHSAHSDEEEEAEPEEESTAAAAAAAAGSTGAKEAADDTEESHDNDHEGEGHKAHTLVLHASAYDAGSEANSELCADIPGGPCNGTAAAGTAAAAAGEPEGFVHVHRGVYGVGDLEASEYGWQNPTAKVQIELEE